MKTFGRGAAGTLYFLGLAALVHYAIAAVCYAMGQLTIWMMSL